MIASLFSLLLAALIYFIPFEAGKPDISDLSYLFIIISGFILVALPITYALSWAPLFRGEQSMTPRLIEKFSKDKHIRFSFSLLFLFPLLSLALLLLEFYTPGIEKKYVLMVWVFMLGVALDLFHNYLKRVASYLNPFKLMSIFVNDTQAQVTANNIEEVVNGIDSISEVSIRAIERSNTSLAIEGVSNLRDIGNHFLGSAKALPNLDPDLKNMEESHEDKVSYTIFYLLSHLESINDKAVARKLETISTQTISALGRIAIAAAKYDMSIATYPILFLGKCAQKAQAAGLKDIGVKSEIVLMEVAKTISKEVDMTYLEIKSFYMTLIGQLDQIAQEIFRQDKSTSIKFLEQPFLELKEIFNTPALEKHQDTPAIQAELDRVLGTYVALEQVMGMVPPVPDLNLGSV